MPGAKKPYIIGILDVYGRRRKAAEKHRIRLLIRVSQVRDLHGPPEKKPRQIKPFPGFFVPLNGKEDELDFVAYRGLLPWYYELGPNYIQ